MGTPFMTSDSDSDEESNPNDPYSNFHSSLNAEQKVQELRLQLRFQKQQFSTDRAILLDMIEKTAAEKEEV